MRRRLVWSPEAEADLADIWDYYAGVAGRRTADKKIRAIGETMRLIEDHPYGGRGRDDVRLGLRSIAASPHVIFYRVTPDNVAQIVRVLDGRRDIEAIFDEPEPS
jgi:toxin ParE1/3/4